MCVPANQDGYRFVLDQRCAMLSGTIKSMLSMDEGGALAADRLL